VRVCVCLCHCVRVCMCDENESTKASIKLAPRLSHHIHPVPRGPFPEARANVAGPRGGRAFRKRRVFPPRVGLAIPPHGHCQKAPAGRLARTALVFFLKQTFPIAISALCSPPCHLFCSSTQQQQQTSEKRFRAGRLLPVFQQPTGAFFWVRARTAFASSLPPTPPWRDDDTLRGCF
jgi:hypothetical protein